MGFTQKQSVAITYMLTAILGLCAVVLTTSGEMRALVLIGSILLVGGIGVTMIFGNHKHRAAHHEEKIQPPAAQDPGEIEEEIEDE